MAAQKLGVEVALIAKSILLEGQGRGIPHGCAAGGGRKLASGKVKKLTEVKHRMATAQEIQEQTGFNIGVCPFGLTLERNIVLKVDSKPFSSIYSFFFV